MSTLARSAITAAQAQLHDEDGPEVKLCPLQTLEKSYTNSVALWFTFCKQGENPQRVLTLVFDQTKENLFPRSDYLRKCQQRIVEEIRGFWDGSTSEPNRERSIP